MPRGSGPPAPLPSGASVLSSSSSSSVASAPSEPAGPVLPTWAVEVQEGPSARKANEAALAAAIADSTFVPGPVALRIVMIITRVPCSLGGELVVSKVDKRAIRQHELRVFQMRIQPLVAIASAKKMPVKFAPVRNDSREAGLVEAVERMGASRLYITEPRNSSKTFEELSLHLPGGCTLVCMREGRKAKEHHVQGVSFVDWPQDSTEQGIPRQASLGCSSLLHPASQGRREGGPRGMENIHTSPPSGFSTGDLNVSGESLGPRTSLGPTMSLGPRVSGAAPESLSLHSTSTCAGPATPSGAAPAGPFGWVHAPQSAEPRTSGRPSASLLSGSAHRQCSEGHPGLMPATRSGAAALPSHTTSISCSLSRDSFSGGTPSLPDEKVKANLAEQLPSEAWQGARALSGDAGIDSELLLFRQHVQKQLSLLQMHKCHLDLVEQQKQEQEQQPQHEPPQADPGLSLLPGSGTEGAEAQWRRCWEELQALERQVIEARLNAQQQLLCAAIRGRAPLLPPAQQCAERVAEDHVTWPSPAEKHQNGPEGFTDREAASLDVSNHLTGTVLAEDQWQVELSFELRSASLPGEGSSSLRGSARSQAQPLGKGHSASLRDTRTSARALQPVSRSHSGGRLSSTNSKKPAVAAEARGGGGRLWSVSLLGKKVTSFNH